MVAEILNRLAKLSPERRLLRSRGQRPRNTWLRWTSPERGVQPWFNCHDWSVLTGHI